MIGSVFNQMAATVLSSVSHPMLNGYVIKKLNKHRVRTVYSFVKIDSDQLVKITNLPPESIHLIKHDLVFRYAGSFATAETAINDATDPISTGISSLDTLLQGGLVPGHIYELCGTSGSGKTHLCFTLAANFALRYSSLVYFVDTKCDFSAIKLQNILENRHKPLNERVLGHTMARIKVERILSPRLLVQSMEDLAEREHLDATMKVKLLIIDSLPSLWYLYQDSKSSCQPLGLLTKLICSLRKLATEHSIVVIIVNLSTWLMDTTDSVNSAKRNSIGGYYPALGRYWESAPGTRLKLVTTDEEDRRVLIVWKSNYIRAGSEVQFRINNTGVC